MCYKKLANVYFNCDKLTLKSSDIFYVNVDICNIQIELEFSTEDDVPASLLVPGM